MSRVLGLVLIAALVVVALLWIFNPSDETESERVAKELTEDLEEARQRTDSLEGELELQRRRTDSILSQSREREVIYVEVAREAGQEKVQAGADLRETLVTIPDSVVRDTALAQLDRLEAAQEEEVEALRSVNGELRLQMQAMAELQAATDSARVGWMQRALAEQAAREAWQRAFRDKKGAGLSILERILPDGKAQEIAKGGACVLLGVGVERTTGEFDDGALATAGCFVGALAL